MKFPTTLVAGAVVGFISPAECAQQWPILGNVAAAAQQSPLVWTGGCRGACLALHENFPSQVVFPKDKLYGKELSSFWSLHQSSLLPACIFLPQSSDDVASAVVTARKTNCPFAAKSGGHAAFAGASNIAGGLTIDMTKLNKITIHENQSIVSVGTGNTWIGVYRRLEGSNRTVVGGRIGGVGVGGLTLGGGISFFSNMYGWACDNVASYEVVTAAGKVVTASPTINQDLYWALRGGGNNFGLVTKFDLYSYPQDQGLMWVGKVRHPGAQNTSLVEAFVDFGASATDPKATVIFSVLYLQAQNELLCVTEMDYAEPVPEDEPLPVFDSFFEVQEALQVTRQTKRLVEAIDEHTASNPSGLRQSYWTATLRLDRALVQYAVDVWAQEVDPLKKVVAGFLPVVTFQIVTRDAMQHMRGKGGNPLGLKDEEGPLVIVMASCMWTEERDDEAVFSAYSKWLARTTAKASELGLDHQYVYMNYASQFQDPIRSYGEKNAARLKDVAMKYDPNKVFQILQPGYFKLWRDGEREVARE